MLGGLQGVNYLQRTSIRGPRVLGVEQVWQPTMSRKPLRTRGWVPKAHPRQGKNARCPKILCDVA